jgi:hypothetical protein
MQIQEPLCSSVGRLGLQPLSQTTGAHHPAALHLPQVVNQVLERTSSGTFAGNEGFIYLTLPSLPLGGVGESLLSPTTQSTPPGRLAWYPRPASAQLFFFFFFWLS